MSLYKNPWIRVKFEACNHEAFVGAQSCLIFEQFYGLFFCHFERKASLKSSLNSQINADLEKSCHFEVFKPHIVGFNTIVAF